MQSDSEPKWIGEPLPISLNDKKFFPQIRIKGDDICCGDCVEVRLLGRGTSICFVLALYEEHVTKRRSYQMADVLRFAHDRGSRDELLLTKRVLPVKVADIHMKVSVMSHKEYIKEFATERSFRPDEKLITYFCRYGYEERTDDRTKAFDWDKLFSQVKTVALREMGPRYITDMLQANQKTRQGKLTNKGKARAKSFRAARPEPSTDASSSSESSSSDDEASAGESDDSHAHRKAAQLVTPQKRKRGALSQTPKSQRTRTPGSRTHRIMAPLEVNPLPVRIDSPQSEAHLTPHQIARQRLHVAEVPTSLPCREKEFATIYSQVESAIIDNDSALLYISGTPGAGKTATVREVIAALQENVLNKELYPFKFVEINGMKIPDPAQAYSRLWEALTGERVTAQHALSLLQEYYSQENPSDMPCVVLMDELDQLTTTKQEVMYNFFQWPSMPNTRLIVVAVSNTMDLPERFLAHKVASRLGLSRIAFASYTREQLNKIVSSRLQSVPGMDVDAAAIDFACLKVASISGDARRALDICRRAFELAEAALAAEELAGGEQHCNKNAQARQSKSGAPAGRITMQVIREAIRSMSTSPLQRYLTALPLLAKLFLKALLACVRRSGVAENSLGDIIEDVTRLCKVNTRRELEMVMNASGLQPYAILETAKMLSHAGIIYLENLRSERHCRIRLKIPEPDLVGSMESDASVRTIT